MAKNLTEGPEWRQLLLFALPMMGAQLLQVTYSMVDAIVVGNFISSNALGAVSIPGPVIWVASSISAGMGSGVNIIVAQYFGAMRRKEICSAAVTSVLFSVALGLFLSAAGILSASAIVRDFLRTPPEMETDAVTYLAIYSIGFFFQILYQIFYGITRALGDSKASLLFLLVAAVLNLVLDLVFVVYLKMDVAGAAIASVAAQIGSAAAALFYLLFRYSFLYSRESGARPAWGQLSLILRVSIPVTLQMAVQSAGFLLLQRMVNSFGPASIEGFAAMGKTEELMHIPIICISTALASFVGQNMGAGQVHRVERGVRAALVNTVILSVILGGLMLIFDRHILGLYNITGEALLRGREHLDVMCLLLPVFTVHHIFNGALQGAGDVRIPVISSFADLALRLIFTALLALTPVSFRSIYLSTPPAWITACLITAARFRQGTWKQRRIFS